jgi:photosystem II stability/assembly factor-like uncharacterized protein
MRLKTKLAILLAVLATMVAATLPAVSGPAAAEGKSQKARKSAQPKAAPAKKPEPQYRWDVQRSGVEDELLTVFFVNPKIGWAAGDRGALIKTTDGGDTWTRLQEPQSGQHFEKIVFLDDNEGWLSGRGLLLHTTDGGRSWQPASKIQGAGFGNGTLFEHAWYVVNTSGVYRTEDGGTTWKKLWPVPRNDYHAIALADAQHIFLTGSQGRVASSSDGGATWTETQLPGNPAISTIQFVSPQAGWIMRRNVGTLATTDGGATWKPQSLGIAPYRPLNGMQFRDARQGYVATDHDVQHTSNGGDNWSAMGGGWQDTLLTAVYFPSGDEGWTVGKRGFIAHFHPVEEK